uniref:Dentin sialophosphoprotein n=1 Tax=Caenorhabditis tropicalis TaxID=1561998 RepID=A0A1I7TPN4_9PELO
MPSLPPGLVALLFLGVVHSSLLDDLKARFGSASSGFSNPMFANSAAKNKFSGFAIPQLDASKASMVQSSSIHKGHHQHSGSSSNTHSLTMIGADGKNITENDSKKTGYNKETKVDEANDSLMIRGANGSVINTGKSHNKSSDDDSSYNLENSQKTYADKNGTVLNDSVNKINNQSRSAALDEAEEFQDQTNGDGTFIRNKTGHKNNDEHLSHNVLDERANSMVNADGTSRNVSNRKGSVGDSHRSDSNSFSDFESLDAQGNKKTQNASKKASSEKGSSSDFEANLESQVNADGTSFSNSSGNHNNTNYDKAMSEELLSKKLVNADGTSSVESSHAGGNSSKITSSGGSYSDVNAKGLNGTFSHTSNNKTDDYSLDEANQSAGSMSEQIGKNGQRSRNESSIESGRKVEKNADGTYKDESKGSNSRVNRTDGGSKVLAGSFSKGLGGVMKNESLSLSDAYNTSDAESNQFNHLHEKGANGTEIQLQKDSRQMAASSNGQRSMEASADEVDASGNIRKSKTKEEAANHDSISGSSDTELKSVKRADGSETITNDSSNQTASEHLDSAKKSAEDHIKNADGTFSDVVSDSASRHAVKDASDARQNLFADVRADGSSSQIIRNSVVDSHSNDTDATSNQSKHSKDANGVEINDVQHSNISTSHLTEGQVASANKKLAMADGTLVVNNDESHISHEKARNDGEGSHVMKQKNADGSSVDLNTGFKNHMDLETRGEGGAKQRYQKLGNGTESSLDVGYEKSMAKGGDTSESHDNLRSDDGKGHFIESKNGTESHHKIDDKDVKHHKTAIVM